MGNVGLFVLFLCAAGAVAAYFLWTARNHSGYRQRLKKTAAQNKGRASDERKLTPHQAHALATSKDMAAKGQVRAAAQLLEQSGLRRECIELFEQSGFIDDAAGILIKMQRPNRAGYVYARNGRWNQGADCFIAAGLPAEAGKCLREAQRYEEAAQQFKLANKYEDAAACFCLMERWQEAGRLYIKLKLSEKAASAYEKVFSVRASLSGVEFTAEELEFFSVSLLQGDSREGYVFAVSRSGQFVRLIRSMLLDGKVKEAAAAFIKSSTDLGPTLMSEVNLLSSEGRNLATMFLAVDHLRHAGMVFEQLGDFRLAAKAFEQAEDYERASYCCERSGDIEKAKLLRSKASAVNSGAPSGRLPTEHVKTPKPAASLAGHASDATTAVPQEVDSNSSLAGAKRPVGVFALDPLSQATNQPMEEDQLRFHKCELFLDLDYSQKSKIWAISTVGEFNEDEAVVEWDEEPSGLFLVLSGELQCVLKSESAGDMLETIGPGQTYGELWLLAENAASVKLIAKTKARLLIINRSKFVKLLDQDGTIARRVYKHFTHKLLAKMLNPSKPQDKRRAS